MVAVEENRAAKRRLTKFHWARMTRRTLPFDALRSISSPPPRESRPSGFSRTRHTPPTNLAVILLCHNSSDDLFNDGFIENQIMRAIDMAADPSLITPCAGGVHSNWLLFKACVLVEQAAIASTDANSPTRKTFVVLSVLEIMANSGGESGFLL